MGSRTEDVSNEIEEIIGDSPRKCASTHRVIKPNTTEDCGDSKNFDELIGIYSDDARFRESLNTMRKRNLYTDVHLTSNGVSIPAHKYILASGSKYFYKQFIVDDHESKEEKSNDESSSDVLEMEDFDPKILELLIDFVYTGYIPDLYKLTSPNIGLLLKSGDFLEIENFERILLAELQAHLNNNNFKHVLHLASKLKDSKSTNNVLMFLIKNLDNVWVSTDFMDLSEQLVYRIFIAAADILQSHDILLQVAIVWVKHQLEQRTGCLEKLTSAVDYSKVSQSLARFLLRDQFILTGPASVKDDLMKIVDIFSSSTISNRQNQQSDCNVFNQDFQEDVKLENSIVIVGRDDANRGSAIRFYPSVNRWTELEDLGTSLEFKQGIGYYREKIFFIGGQLVNGNKLSTCYTFDLLDKSLFRLPDLITPRSMSLVFGYEDSVYVAGGAGRYSPAGLSSVECLESLQCPVWKYRHAMKLKRDNSAVCCYLDGKVMIAGGGGARCEYYTPSDKQWRQVSHLPLDGFQGIEPCFASASGHLFAFKYFKPQHAVFLDVESDQWYSINARGSIPEWITILTGMKEKIYALDKVRKLHEFDSTTAVWSVLNKLPKPFLYPSYMAATTNNFYD